MLLDDLNRLYDELLADDYLPPPGFQRRQVRLTIDLDQAGHCTGVVDAGRDGPERLVPTLARSGRNPPAQIVVDNGQYVLGIAQRAEPKEQDKARRAVGLYQDRLASAVESLGDVPGLGEQLRAVQRFTEDDVLARTDLENRGLVVEPGRDGAFPHASALVRFRVDGVDPVDHPHLQRWWAEVVNADLGTGEVGTCQISYQAQEIARKMPEVRNVGGTQPRLISSNFDAAERYHASQASGSQIGVETAVRTHQALNWLLSDRGHHRRMGGLTFVWWVDGDPDFDPFSPVLDPAESVDQMMSAAWRGRRPAALDQIFRLLALSVSEARVVVRLDHVSAVGDLHQRIERWLDLVKVPGKGGSTWRVPIELLAKAATGPGSGSARQAQRDRLVADLAIALVTGRAPLTRVRNAAVLRCRAERAVTPARAALLKICQQFQEEDMSDYQPSAGELCGRLLSQLEQAQWAALGDTNRTVTDRYYAKASVNPQQAFPQLLRGAQAHLSKARRRNKGAHVVISRRLGELAGQLRGVGGIPQALSMAEQADFALGYWEERQARFQRAATDDQPQLEGDQP